MAEGLREPEFDFDGSVAITLWRPVRTENAQETTGNQPVNNQEPTRNQPDIKSRLIAVLGEDPTISRSAMAEQLGISEGSLRHHLEKLKSEGIIRREGADKGGKWIVVE